MEQDLSFLESMAEQLNQIKLACEATDEQLNFPAHETREESKVDPDDNVMGRRRTNTKKGPPSDALNEDISNTKRSGEDGGNSPEHSTSQKSEQDDSDSGDENKKKATKVVEEVKLEEPEFGEERLKQDVGPNGEQLAEDEIVEEEIYYQRGKKQKRQKIVKLRSYEIQQPDLATQPNGTLIYHIDRALYLHEDEGKVRMVPQAASPTKTKKSEKVASGAAGEEPKSAEVQQSAEEQKPQQQEIKYTAPLITAEQLRDFQMTTVKVFQQSNRLLFEQEKPENIFPNMNRERLKANKQELHIEKFIKNSVLRRRVNPDFSTKRLVPPPQPIYIRDVSDKTLFFNAQFESGNLREVERIKDGEYNLFLNFDHNTLNYSQWYFFSVRNIGKGHTVRFNINNLQKDDSTYNIGMKPFVFSQKKNKEAKTYEWGRGGFDVRYYKNSLKTMDRECAPDYDWDHEMIPCYEYDNEDAMKIGLNTLSFSYTFEHENDITFFSYFQPYTLSDLKDLLFVLKTRYPEDHLNQILKVNSLCETVAGNPCYVLTITQDVKKHDIDMSRLSKETSLAMSKKGVDGEETKNEEALEGKQEGEPQRKSSNNKQVIVLTARVHPGESNSQFMVHGAIEFLLQQNDKEAQILRETFIFKIIPMLNPDGVIIGNYRCNLTGADLNRRWPNPSRILHPTIYYTKKLVAACHKENQVVLFCDMHGHSRKRNVFMYGCSCGQSEINQHKNNNLIKVMPYFLAQKNSLFSFADCKFANERDKEATARLVMFKQFGIINSYTLESTFYAAFNQKHSYLQSQKRKPVEDDQQVKGTELIQIGHDFCSTLIAMINSKILKKKFTVDTSLHHLYQMNQKTFKKQLQLITSKEESATASLLGFAIANRAGEGVSPEKHDEGDSPSKNKDDKDRKGKAKHGAESTSPERPRKVKKEKESSSLINPQLCQRETNSSSNMENKGSQNGNKKLKGNAEHTKNDVEDFYPASIQEQLANSDSIELLNDVQQYAKRRDNDDQQMDFNFKKKHVNKGQSSILDDSLIGISQNTKTSQGSRQAKFAKSPGRAGRNTQNAQVHSSERIETTKDSKATPGNNTKQNASNVQLTGKQNKKKSNKQVSGTGNVTNSGKGTQNVVSNQNGQNVRDFANSRETSVANNSKKETNSPTKRLRQQQGKEDLAKCPGNSGAAGYQTYQGISKNAGKDLQKQGECKEEKGKGAIGSKKSSSKRPQKLNVTKFVGSGYSSQLENSSGLKLKHPDQHQGSGNNNHTQPVILRRENIEMVDQRDRSDKSPLLFQSDMRRFESEDGQDHGLKNQQSSFNDQQQNQQYYATKATNQTSQNSSSMREEPRRSISYAGTGRENNFSDEMQLGTEGKQPPLIIPESDRQNQTNTYQSNQSPSPSKPIELPIPQIKLPHNNSRRYNFREQDDHHHLPQQEESKDPDSIIQEQYNRDSQKINDTDTHNEQSRSRRGEADEDENFFGSNDLIDQYLQQVSNAEEKNENARWRQSAMAWESNRDESTQAVPKMTNPIIALALQSQAQNDPQTSQDDIQMIDQIKDINLSQQRPKEVPLQLQIKKRSKLVQELPPVRNPNANLSYEGPYTPSARNNNHNHNMGNSSHVQQPNSSSAINGAGTLASSLQDDIVNKIMLTEQSGAISYSSSQGHRKRIDLSSQSNQQIAHQNQWQSHKPVNSAHQLQNVQQVSLQQQQAVNNNRKLSQFKHNYRQHRPLEKRMSSQSSNIVAMNSFQQQAANQISPSEIAAQQVNLNQSEIVGKHSQQFFQGQNANAIVSNASQNFQNQSLIASHLASRMSPRQDRTKLESLSGQKLLPGSAQATSKFQHHMQKTNNILDSHHQMSHQEQHQLTRDFLQGTTKLMVQKRNSVHKLPPTSQASSGLCLQKGQSAIISGSAVGVMGQTNQQWYFQQQKSVSSSKPNRHPKSIQALNSADNNASFHSEQQQERDESGKQQFVLLQTQQVYRSKNLPIFEGLNPMVRSDQLGEQRAVSVNAKKAQNGGMRSAQTQHNEYMVNQQVMSGLGVNLTNQTSTSSDPNQWGGQTQQFKLRYLNKSGQGSNVAPPLTDQFANKEASESSFDNYRNSTQVESPPPKRRQHKSNKMTMHNLVATRIAGGQTNFGSNQISSATAGSSKHNNPIGGSNYEQIVMRGGGANSSDAGSGPVFSLARSQNTSAMIDNNEQAQMVGGGGIRHYSRQIKNKQQSAGGPNINIQGAIYDRNMNHSQIPSSSQTGNPHPLQNNMRMNANPSQDAQNMAQQMQGGGLLNHNLTNQQQLTNDSEMASINFSAKKNKTVRSAS